MRKEETKEKGIAPKKDAGGIKAATSSGLGLRTWLGLKDPRIVRVSRSFGGKDRHSKVSTVKGLRDRRVRLSVQTAIQLYDLQDRLGVNQPSKVVDWLLNATQHEIDKLPPLQMPPAGNVAGGNCSSADLSQTHDHYHHQMDSSIYIKMLTENGDARINNGFNMFGSSTATRGGTAGRGLMLSNNPNESTRSSWNSDNSSTAGRTESMDQPQQRCGGAEQTGKGALLANSTLFPYNGAGMCTTSYFHMEPPPGGAEEPSEAVASLMLSSQPDHQTSNVNGTYNHRPMTLSPPASLSLMPGPQLMLCPSGRSPMAPIFLSNNAGTTPVQYDAKHLTQVDYLSAHNAQFTPQSFFSGSLFASFPTVIPTTPYIPNPK